MFLPSVRSIITVKDLDDSFNIEFTRKNVLRILKYLEKKKNTNLLLF